MDLNVGVMVNLDDRLPNTLQTEINVKKRSILKHVFSILIMSFVCIFAIEQKRKLNEVVVYQMYTMIITHLTWLYKTCETQLGPTHVTKLFNYMLPISASLIHDFTSGKKITYRSLILPTMTAYATGSGPGNTIKRSLNLANKSSGFMKQINMLMPLVGQQSLAGQLLPMIHHNITQCLCIIGALGTKQLLNLTQDTRNFVRFTRIQGRIRLNSNARRLMS